MGWGNAIQGVTGLLGAGAAYAGANAQEKAAKAGLDWTKQVYGDAKGNFSPYLAGGQQGLAALLDPNGYQQSPGYDWIQSEAMRGVNQSMAARGAAWSPGAALAAQDRAGNIAAMDYNNWWDREMGLANMGQNAAAQLGSIGVGTSAQVNNAYGNIGDAKATGYGAIGGAISGLGGLAQGWVGGGSTQSAYSPTVSSGGWGSPQVDYSNWNF